MKIQLKKEKLKEPVRQCFSCRVKNLKKNLIRVVRTKKGDILIDDLGKIDGRGAYLCYNEKCLQQLEKKRGLQRSLKKNVDEKIYLDIMERIKMKNGWI